MILFLNFEIKINKNGDWGLGIGDWGVGVGAHTQNPKTQTPKPKPQTPKTHIIIKIKIKIYFYKIY